MLKEAEAEDKAYESACNDAVEEMERADQEESQPRAEDEVLDPESLGFINSEDDGDAAAGDGPAAELSEEETAEAQGKAREAFVSARAETSKVKDAAGVKKLLNSKRAEIEKSIAKIKDRVVRDKAAAVLRVLEKIAAGDVIVECGGELNEKKHGQVVGVTLQFVVASVRLLCFICKLASFGIIGLGAAVKVVGEVAKKILDKCDGKLATEEEETEVDEDDVEIAEDGVSLKEADDREVLSHALDPLGIKVSTANLKTSDSCELSVVKEAVKKEIAKRKQQKQALLEVDLEKLSDEQLDNLDAALDAGEAVDDDDATAQEERTWLAIL